MASILEKAAELPTTKMIVFDLHGEYSSLKFAKQLRIAGPDDLNSKEEGILFCILASEFRRNASNVY